MEKKAVVGSAMELAEFSAESFCPNVLSATDLTDHEVERRPWPAD